MCFPEMPKEHRPVGDRAFISWMIKICIALDLPCRIGLSKPPTAANSGRIYNGHQHRSLEERRIALDVRVRGSSHRSV